MVWVGCRLGVDLTDCISDMENSEDLKYLTELIAQLAMQVISCGAETRLAVQLAQRVARAYGCKSEIIIIPAMVCVRLYRGDQYYSTFHHSPFVGLNLHNLITYTRLCRQVEQGELDPRALTEALRQIKSYSYNSLVLIFVIGLATWAFCLLNGGSVYAAMTAFLAGSMTMALKHLLHRYSLFPLFIFSCCGFVGTILSISLGSHLFNLSNMDLSVAILVCMLPFVPGFPFINGILDIFKGYVTMGINRLFRAGMLIAGVCVGIVFALSIFPVR